jgi:hypothetical protein
MCRDQTRRNEYKIYKPVSLSPFSFMEFCLRRFRPCMNFCLNLRDILANINKSITLFYDSPNSWNSFL